MVTNISHPNGAIPHPNTDTINIQATKMRTEAYAPQGQGSTRSQHRGEERMVGRKQCVQS
jgi:hypothetical protein